MTQNGDKGFDALCDEIVRQHDRIRGLLEDLQTKATEVCRPGSCVPSCLHATLDSIVRVLREHMDFEERAIAEDSIARGGQSQINVTDLRDEHVRQRRELDRMVREADSSDDRITLALAIRGFVSDVLLDMNLEEGRLVSMRRDRSTWQ